MHRALDWRLGAKAVILKVSANLVVQLCLCLKSPQTTFFDRQQVCEFAFYGLIGSQVGNWVQILLEEWFPTGNTQSVDALPVRVGQEKRPMDKRPNAATESSNRRKCFQNSRNIRWRNILVKLILDQTVGLFISGCIFLTCTNIARGPHISSVFLVIRRRIWPLIKAGWHIWPLVAILNFLFVPVRSRVLVAVCVGFGWSIFLSIFSMRG